MLLIFLLKEIEFQVKKKKKLLLLFSRGEHLRFLLYEKNNWYIGETGEQEIVLLSSFSCPSSSQSRYVYMYLILKLIY